MSVFVIESLLLVFFIGAIGEIGEKSRSPLSPLPWIRHWHFPSTPLPSLPSLLLSERDMVGWCYTGCVVTESQWESG